MAYTDQLQKVIDAVSPKTLTGFFQALGKFRPTRQDYSHALSEDQDLLDSLEQLGEIEWDSAERLIVLTGKVNGDMTRRRSRTAQYAVAKKVIKQDFYDAAIFVFYDDEGRFRFSLITALYSGKKREFSTFKRYTYFVAPDEPHQTFLECVGSADFSSVEAILEAFSVEPVTKDFYKSYANVFKETEDIIATANSLNKKNSEQAEILRMYTQLLFNRLMFLRFIEKKNWLTFEDSGKKYLSRIYQAGGIEGKSFFQSRLVPLFFEGLAVEGAGIAGNWQGSIPQWWAV